MHTYIDHNNSGHVEWLTNLEACLTNARAAIDAAKHLTRALALKSQFYLKCKMIPTTRTGNGILHQIE